jgi:capsular exopolysaccharide synthesis family protein
MSHIFDALQQSAVEQADIELPSAAVATELLEATERKTAAARAKAIVIEAGRLEGETIILNALRSVVDTAPVTPTSYGRTALSEIAAKPEPVDQFSQFQSLKVLVPAFSRIVCITEQESLPAEKFRFLSVRLRQMQQSRTLKKLVVTSTLPQEGKSTAAANLACTLARRGQQKTLLLDGDLRRPSVARLFGLGKIRGITDCLQGECTPASSIYRLEDAGIWVLPAGNIVRNPLELMQSGRLSSLMDQLSSWFDWIIVDTPPVLPLADTSIWMRISDGVLLVTCQGRTEKEQLKRGLEAIEQSKLLGALLNCSTNTTEGDYYYQYRPDEQLASGSD